MFPLCHENTEEKKSCIPILPLDICCQNMGKNIGGASFSWGKKDTANDILMLSKHIVSFMFFPCNIKLSENVNLKLQNPKHTRNPDFLNTWLFKS